MRPACVLATLLSFAVFSPVCGQQPKGHVALLYREQIVAGIFVLLALITISSLGIVIFSKDPNKVSFVSDVLKGIIGFAIGILTTQL